MKPADWQRVKAVLAEVLELEPERRGAWLDATLGDQPELAAEVRSLLAAYREGGAVLEPLSAAPRPVTTPDTVEPGTMIGAWRILRELGRGGMGVVYLAARADQAFERRVALKLIHHGAVGPDSERRFLAERRILARLDHPGIARLLDGGTTSGGRPFLVMELVEGEPLDRWCRRYEPDLDARLDLFLAICDAVDFAHRNLVVHRDLKPSNVMVDAAGAPKLLDFGIAKLLDDELGGEPAVTRTGLRAMTPEYASPEQLRGEPIATTSDVYALGVILYELLTGRRPYELGDRGLSEVVRLVCEVDPPPPSTAVRRAASAEPSAAPPRALHGDLDAIVMKALRKDPAGRYQSAQQLAADLGRQREGRPVEARRGSFAYRAGKLVRRHRLAVTAAAGVVVLLAGFAAAMTVQVARTRRALARAEAETAKAVAVQQFLERTLDAADPEGDAGREVTVAEALDDARDRVAGAFAGQPAVAAAVRQLIGRLYSNMGRYDEAEPLLRAALAGRRELAGDAAGPALAETLESLAVLLGRSGRAGEAETLLDEALAIRRSQGDAARSQVAKDLDLLAHAANAGGDPARALELVGEALATFREALGEDDVSVAHALATLAGFARVTGDLDAAESSLLQAVSILDRLPDAPPATRGELESDLGGLLEARGRYPEAEQHYRSALATYREVYGDEHHWVAQAMVRLGTVLTREGRYDEAETTLRDAVAMLRRVLEPGHPDVATGLNNLAFLLAERGQLDQAAAILERVLALQRAAIPGHPFVAVTLRSLATIALRQGRPEPARRRLEEALSIQRDAFGEQHPATARSELALGWALGELGDWERAAEMQAPALAALEAAFGSGHPLVAEARGLYGRTLAELGRKDEAATQLRQALPELHAAFPADNYRILAAQAALASLSSRSARRE